MQNHVVIKPRFKVQIAACIFQDLYSVPELSRNVPDDMTPTAEHPQLSLNMGGGLAGTPGTYLKRE